MTRTRSIFLGLTALVVFLAAAVTPQLSVAADPGKTPALSSTVPKSDGFSFVISNYDATFSWQITSSAGQFVFQAGLVTITGLFPGQSATVSVTSSKSGFSDSTSTITGSAKNPVAPSPSSSPTPEPTPTFPAPTPAPTPTPTQSVTQAALKPTFSSLISTSDGFTFTITNHNPDFTWSAIASTGKVVIKGSLITVAQLNPGQSSVVTVTSARSGYATGTNTVTGSAKSSPVSTPAPVSTSTSNSSGSTSGGSGISPSVGGTPSQSPTPTQSALPAPSPSASPSSSPTLTQKSTPTASTNPSPIASNSPAASQTPTSTRFPTAIATPTPKPSQSAASQPELKAGEPVVMARAPLTKNARVFIPIILNSKIPELDSKTKSPVSNLKVGGLNKAQAKVIPTVIVEVSKRPIEVQFAANLPTSIVVIGFKPKAKVEIEIGNFGKKRTSLGDAKANASGSVVLSPITFTKSGESYMLYLNSKANKVSMRVRS